MLLMNVLSRCCIDLSNDAPLPSDALEDFRGRRETSYFTSANDERAGGVLQPIGVSNEFKGFNRGTFEIKQACNSGVRRKCSGSLILILSHTIL